MSISDKISEVLAANPGYGWNDLVMRQLQTALSNTRGNITDLWMLWFAQQGYTFGGLSERMNAYWAFNSTPTSERNLSYLGYSVFYSGPPPVVVNNGWFFNEPAASGHLLTSGII